MLIHGKIMKQFPNISGKKEGNNLGITLVFEESEIFYLALDREIERTRPVKVIFNYEKAQNGSKLLKKIASCSNGDDALTRIREFALKVPEMAKAYKEKDISKIFEIYDEIGKESIYALYKTTIKFDEDTASYTVFFEPNDKDKPKKIPFHLMM